MDLPGRGPRAPPFIVADLLKVVVLSGETRFGTMLEDPNMPGVFELVVFPTSFVVAHQMGHVQCEAGSVNAGAGAFADVLLVNGSAGGIERTVQVGLGQPIGVSMLASPSGPALARYVLWA